MIGYRARIRTSNSSAGDNFRGAEDVTEGVSFALRVGVSGRALPFEGRDGAPLGIRSFMRNLFSWNWFGCHCTDCCQSFLERRIGQSQFVQQIKNLTRRAEQ